MLFMYYVWVLGRFIYDILLSIFNKLNLEPLFTSILYTSNYNDDKFLLRLVNQAKAYFSLNDKFSFKIQKSLPTIFFFKLYFNKVNYENTKLKLIVKQYLYFTKSFKYSYFTRFFKKFSSSKINLFFVFVIIEGIFFKKYYNLLSPMFFFKISELNLIKFNWVFFNFLRNANKFFIIFNQKLFSDWYKLSCNNINIIGKTKLSFWYKRLYKEIKIDKYKYFYKIYPKYNDNYFYSKFGKRLKKLFFTYKYKYMFILKISNLHDFKFKIASKFKIKEFLAKTPIRFLDSSLNKYITLKKLDNFNFFFLRKNRIFNKSRYSRNRQLYRTGVYWCLWLNIIIVYGLFFVFYRFTFNFGYMWIGVFILILSMIISKVIKYNFYNFKKISLEFFLLFKWYGYIIWNLLIFIRLVFSKYLYNLNIYNYISSFFLTNNIFNLIFFNKNIYTFKLVNYFLNIFKKWDLWIFKFLWQSMKEKDTSFLRYKTILHFFKQLSKIHLMV